MSFFLGYPQFFVLLAFIVSFRWMGTIACATKSDLLVMHWKLTLIQYILNVDSLIYYIWMDTIKKAVIRRQLNGALISDLWSRYFERAYHFSMSLIKRLGIVSGGAGDGQSSGHRSLFPAAFLTLECCPRVTDKCSDRICEDLVDPRENRIGSVRTGKISNICNYYSSFSHDYIFCIIEYFNLNLDTMKTDNDVQYKYINKSNEPIERFQYEPKTWKSYENHTLRNFFMIFTKRKTTPFGPSIFFRTFCQDETVVLSLWWVLYMCPPVSVGWQRRIWIYCLRFVAPLHTDVPPPSSEMSSCLSVCLSSGDSSLSLRFVLAKCRESVLHTRHFSREYMCMWLVGLRRKSLRVWVGFDSFIDFEVNERLR